MINLIIPAAGNGKRFKEAGYDKPKHLIDVCGKPMIQRVLDSVCPSEPTVVQVITQETLKHPTNGAVETILTANIDASPLLIANCDQIVDIDIDDFMNCSGDGVIAIFKSANPHHSYVNLDNEGYITEIKEKEVISHNAVTGIYFFKNGLDFVERAKRVMKDDVRYNNEYYVSSVIELMVEDGLKIEVYNAPVAILGTPSELQLFEMAVIVGKKL